MIFLVFDSVYAPTLTPYPLARVEGIVPPLNSFTDSGHTGQQVASLPSHPHDDLHCVAMLGMIS